MGFAYGVISADPWHKNYRLPENFEGVVNWIAFCAQHKYGLETQVVQVSLLELEQLYWIWAEEHPEFKKWNELNTTKKLVSTTHRYSPMLEERDFIDLDALIRNAINYIRNEMRRQ